MARRKWHSPKDSQRDRNPVLCVLKGTAPWIAVSSAGMLAARPELTGSARHPRAAGMVTAPMLG
jgi:hypothetical protein